MFFEDKNHSMSHFTNQKYTEAKHTMYSFVKSKTQSSALAHVVISLLPIPNLSFLGDTQAHRCTVTQSSSCLWMWITLHECLRHATCNPVFHRSTGCRSSRFLQAHLSRFMDARALMQVLRQTMSQLQNELMLHKSQWLFTFLC